MLLSLPLPSLPQVPTVQMGQYTWAWRTGQHADPAVTVVLEGRTVVWRERDGRKEERTQSEEKGKEKKTALKFMCVCVCVCLIGASLVAQMVKNLPAMQETWIWFLAREDTLEKGKLPTPVLLPKEFHGQKSPAGYSTWGHKELDMTERLSTAQHITYV